MPKLTCAQTTITWLSSMMNDTRVYRGKLPNKADVIIAELEPFRKNITVIVVESTYNWFWLVDLLMETGYSLHLANPTAIQKYIGPKHSDDKHNAFQQAHMLRLNILPEGFRPIPLMSFNA